MLTDWLTVVCLLQTADQAYQRYYARNYGGKSAPAYGPQYLQAQVVRFIGLFIYSSLLYIAAFSAPEQSSALVEVLHNIHRNRKAY